jgi:hypothetical protein
MANAQATPGAWKTSAPPLSEQNLPRERLSVALEAHFDRQRRQGPVALIAAPAGYGKTTLLAQWAHASTTPVAWYTLDERDNDLALFLRGLTRALDFAISRPRWRVVMALDHLSAGIPSASDQDRLGDLFLRDLQRVVTRPITLILTNFHVLQAEGSTTRLVERLLTEQPDPLGLALESREPPHIPTTLLRQQQRLRVMGEDELSLTDEEFHALLALRDIHLTTQETSVGANIRRVEALTGTGALGHLRRRSDLVSSIATRLQTAPDPTAIEERMRQIQDELAEARRTLQQAQRARAREEAAHLAEREREYRLTTARCDGISPDSPNSPKDYLSA